MELLNCSKFLHTTDSIKVSGNKASLTVSYCLIYPAVLWPLLVIPCHLVSICVSSIVVYFPGSWKGATVAEW